MARRCSARGGPHTLPTRLALAAELLPAAARLALAAPALARGRSLAAELTDAIGDGVLLHPAHLRVAPRHGRTLGRPWLLTPAAIFNLAGVPVTEVPLGLSRRGLPLGVQVAAGTDRTTCRSRSHSSWSGSSAAGRPPALAGKSGREPPARPANTTGTRFLGPRR